MQFLDQLRVENSRSYTRTIWGYMTLYTRVFRSARRYKVICHPNQVPKNKRNFVSTKSAFAFSYWKRFFLQPALSMNFLGHLFNFLSLSLTCVIYLHFVILLLSSYHFFVNFSPLVICSLFYLTYAPYKFTCSPHQTTQRPFPSYPALLHLSNSTGV